MEANAVITGSAVSAVVQGAATGESVGKSSSAAQSISGLRGCPLDVSSPGRPLGMYSAPPELLVLIQDLSGLKRVCLTALAVTSNHPGRPGENRVFCQPGWPCRRHVPFRSHRVAAVKSVVGPGRAG